MALSMRLGMADSLFATDPEGAWRLVSDAWTAVYFAVAECLANLGKHPGATHAWVVLTYEEENLRAVVGDDGRGGAEAAVFDVRLPPTHTDEGLVAAIAVRAARPGFPVRVLSKYPERLYARELLASGEGALGYLLKDRVSDVAEFVDGLRRVAAGGTVLDPEVVASIMARNPGRSNAAVVVALVVSEKAVAKHINNIFTKLDLPIGEEDHRRVRAVLTWLQL